MFAAICLGVCSELLFSYLILLKVLENSPFCHVCCDIGLSLKVRAFALLLLFGCNICKYHLPLDNFHFDQEATFSRFPTFQIRLHNVCDYFYPWNSPYLFWNRKFDLYFRTDSIFYQLHLCTVVLMSAFLDFCGLWFFGFFQLTYQIQTVEAVSFQCLSAIFIAVSFTFR